MKNKTYQPTVTRKACEKLASDCRYTLSLQEAGEVLRRFANTLPVNSAWHREGIKLADAFMNDTTRYNIFAMNGNVKLPFVAFSSLPGLIENGGTCAGAGDCLNFCYSYRAWRYPASFYRQLQNTLLLMHAPQLIADAFMALPSGITFRLYVDGDFDSLATARLWFKLLSQRPDIMTYGYSKSWDILFEAYSEGIIPANYMLNLSSGGIAQSVSIAMMKALPFVRGEFIAVKLASKHTRGFKRYTEKEYHRDVITSVKASLGRNVFSCPGTCGACNKNGHACGTTKFIGVTIAIGVH